jgi:transposase
MNQFPSAAHLSSWAGICPGNNESAGKRRSGHTRAGNRWLCAALTQAAWGASHSKGTYLSAQYRRLAGRRGRKRAIVALGHSLLVIVYHLLKDDLIYQELGADFLDQRNKDHTAKRLAKRLQQLGYDVTLIPKTAA